MYNTEKYWQVLTMSTARGELTASGSHVAVFSNDLSSGGRRTCFDVVAGCSPADRNVLAVTFDLSADGFADRWREHVGDTPDRFGVVDVGARTRSAAATAPTDGDPVRAVPDPDDLEFLDDVVEGYLDAWEAARTVVYFDAAHELLGHASLASVTSFFDRLTASLSSAGARVCASFRTEDVDRRAIQPLAGAFGTVVGPDVPRRAARADPPADPAVDDVVRAVSSRRKRLVLRVLRESDGPLDARELAERVAGAESAPCDDEHVRRVATGLHHAILPEFEDVGFVEVDDGTVAPTAAMAVVEPYLALASTREPAVAR